MNSMAELTINILINSMDFIIFYFLTHNLIEKKLDISKKIILLGMICGIGTGILAEYSDVSLYKLIVTLNMFIMLKYISKKKIHEILIMYEVIFLCIAFLQIVFIILLGKLPFEQSYLFLLIQTLILLTIILIHKKTPLYRIFNIIQKQILLQLFFFMGTIIILITVAYYNFEYTNTKPNTLYTLLIVVIALFGSYQALKNVFFYTNKVPTQLHDVKNILMALHISVNTTKDVNKIRKELTKSLQIIGMDIDTKDIQVNEYTDNILLFINQIGDKHHSQVRLNSDVAYYEDNIDIPLSVILYMLGVLLDNAIESGTKKDIYIKIRIDTNYLLISVANEYERKSIDDFDKMFQVKYSTKSNQLSGYGLPNLSKVVKKHGGEIQVEYTYNTQQASNYLKISIEINTKILMK